MQTIYYNYSRKYLCDASGMAVSDLPELTYAEKPTWRIVPVNDSGTTVIPSGIVAFRAAVKYDFNSATDVAVRSMSSQITGSTSGIDVQLNANTENFLTAVDGQESRSAFFELSGLDLNGDRVFYLSFRIQTRMILDPDLDSNLPEEVESTYLDRASAAVLLAQKTDTTDFTALAGRVSTVETALPGKAAAADAVQPGSVLAFAGTAANIPTGYLLCNGAAVLIADYPALHAAIGGIYDPGEVEAGYFHLPDFRGYFLRGYKSGVSDDLGTAQGDAIRNITDSQTNLLSPYASASTDYNNGNTSAIYAASVNVAPIYNENAINRQVVALHLDASRAVPTAAENRPVNFAVNYIIKY